MEPAAAGGRECARLRRARFGGSRPAGSRRAGGRPRGPEGTGAFMGRTVVEASLERLTSLLPAAAGGRNVTVLSVDGQWLKLLHAARTPRGRTVTSLIALPMQDVSLPDLVMALRARCQAQGVEPESVLIANPSHLTTTRVFSVPSSDWREIRDIVDLQAEKHTPYSKEEILTDFSVVESEASGYSKVMLVIAHQDVVNRAVQIVE